MIDWWFTWQYRKSLQCWNEISLSWTATSITTALALTPFGFFTWHTRDHAHLSMTPGTNVIPCLQQFQRVCKPSQRTVSPFQAWSVFFFISSFFSLFYSLPFCYWTLNRFNIFFPWLQFRQCLFWTFFLFLSFIRVESGTKRILIKKKICWNISIYLINGHSQSIGDELESPWS